MAPCWGFSTLPAATWGSGYVREGLGAPWSGLCVCTHECAYARLCVCLAGAGCRLSRRRLTWGGEAVGQPRTAPILVVCPWASDLAEILSSRHSARLVLLLLSIFQKESEDRGCVPSIAPRFSSVLTVLHVHYC